MTISMFWFREVVSLLYHNLEEARLKAVLIGNSIWKDVYLGAVHSVLISGAGHPLVLLPRPLHLATFLPCIRTITLADLTDSSGVLSQFGLDIAGAGDTANRRDTVHIRGASCSVDTKDGIIPSFLIPPGIGIPASTPVRITSWQASFRPGENNAQLRTHILALDDTRFDRLADVSLLNLPEVSWGPESTVSSRLLQQLDQCDTRAGLQKLRITTGQGLPEEALKAIAKFCPQLVSLEVALKRDISLEDACSSFDPLTTLRSLALNWNGDGYIHNDPHNGANRPIEPASAPFVTLRFPRLNVFIIEDAGFFEHKSRFAHWAMDNIPRTCYVRITKGRWLLHDNLEKMVQARRDKCYDRQD